MASSPVLTLGQEPNPSEDSKTIAAAIQGSRALDPRFQHADDLANFDAELKEIGDDLQAQPADVVVAAAERWSKKYENRKAELSTKISATHDTKPLVTAALGMVASALVSSVLSGVGQAAWGAISGGTVHK
jgi:geranylgeranyl pyrophosphate synthase